MTWRNRGLWWVGFFAGGASGSCSGGLNSTATGDTEAFRQGLRRGGGLDLDPAAALEGMRQALPVLITIGVMVGIIWLMFWLLSIACKAAVISGGRGAAPDGTMPLGTAWSSGLRAFGRLFALELLWLVFWLVAFGVVAWSFITSLGRQSDLVSAGFGLLGWISLLGVIGTVLGVGLAYAQRAVVLEGVGPMAGIGRALHVLRAKLGSTLLVWLVGLALSIGGGIALFIGVIVVALPAALIGAILGFLASLGGIPFVAVMFSVLGLLAFIALMVGAAALNTYLWHYWTLAYLRLAPAERSLEPSFEPSVEPS